jgi:hypothetical protein
MPWKGYRSLETCKKGISLNAPEGLPFRVLHQAFSADNWDVYDLGHAVVVVFAVIFRSP